MNRRTAAALEAIEFVDELPPRQFRLTRDEIDYHRIAKKLRTRPGQWARIPTATGITSTFLSAVNRGTGPAAFRGGEFEYENRNGEAFLRYTGPTQDQETSA
ncbi:hypothetical protein [Nocardia farcinica]|uniref:hypothetical protein n=1 Tax=Nocardia farcinica TaxID=37329 RepID=UPI0024584138|nr:hypothetical protein [Nocardia farcinica]